MNLDSLRNQLMQDEGLKLKPYRDSKGRLTIGVGRNLDDVGISKDEAMYMLDNDIKDRMSYLENWSLFTKLSDNRQLVIADMAFNMGIAGLLEFEKMLNYLSQDDYDNAATEILDSVAAKENVNRYQMLAKMMREG